MAAVVAGMLPMVLMGLLLLSLGLAQAVFPAIDSYHQGYYRLIEVLTVLGNGDSRQGLITMAGTSSLVGMLFDTYAFCHGQSRGYR
jgi:hypothetical protein